MTLHSRRKSSKGLCVHLDNANTHNSRRSTECLHAKTIQPISYWAYSPHLASCNFFLFAHIKRKLTEYDIPDRQNLKSAITQSCAVIIFGVPDLNIITPEMFGNELAQILPGVLW
jgi:hypothetical protein